MTHPAPAAASHSQATPPSVLVADDDEASRRFLHDALEALGARVTGCSDGPQALRAAAAEPFDLLLLDCRMPHSGAREVLAALRADRQAASRQAVAVATTAELAPPLRAELLAEGFGDILIKPCRIDDLRRIMGLTPAYARQLPVLDDEAALLASGDSTTMAALRDLLQQELVTLCNELDRLGNDPDGLRERLHRLRSSCGFCGTAALAAQVSALQQSIGAGPAAVDRAMTPFRAALVQTMQALDRPNVLA
ncbi:MAG TPA: response regulator [Dyella sp.]|nr:response regulator [Dyella sp.]